MGVLSIMHGKPLENVQLAESLLTIFALRVATELERQHGEVARQQAQRNLEYQVIQRTAALSKTNQLLSLEVIDRQQAEAALQQEQEVLKVLLDNVQAGIVACNVEGVLTLFNRAARNFHGLPEQPLPPEQWAKHYDLYRSDGTQMTREEIPLFRALQGEIVNNVEMVIAPKRGGARSLLASGQLLTDAQGNKQGAVIVMHDITERKQAESIRLRLAEERTQLVQQQIQEQTARLEAEADQRRSAFLVEISTTLASSLDYEQTLARVANLVVPYFADWCAIDLLQNQVIERVAVAHWNPEKVALAWELHQKYPTHLDDAEGVPKVLRTGQTEMVAEIPDAAIAAAAKNDEHLQILRELDLKSYIISPLIVRGQILGAILFVTAESNRRYGQADLALADDIVHRAAISIDNARLYQEAQQAQQAAERSTERIARLQSVTAAFSESVTPDQVAEVIVAQGMAVLNAKFAMVALLNETKSELEVVRMVGGGDQGKDWQRFPLHAPVPLAKAVRTGQPIWAESSEVRAVHYPHLAEMYAKQNFGAWISIPLMVENRAVGGISLGFTEPQQLDGDQQAFILSLAQQCAQAIARAHLYESERIARNDAVREAARSAEANRVKDEFLAVLSHELRTPLNPILGWTGLLRSGKLDAVKTAHALETIERNARLQTQLIEDLLDVSRILQGKLKLNIMPVNLAFTIQSAIETVQLAAEAKEIALQTESEEIGREPIENPLFSTAHPPRLVVLGDSVRLQQIIWNLLTNAVKFTDAGGQVNIRLSSSDRHAQIQVIDTGKGIHPDFLPHVFEYFRQADSTTTRQFGGLGLGLAIVRHLVELHGGTVQADSVGEGKGATFTVQLPLLESKKSAGDHADQLSSPASFLHLPLDKIRVLLVDDDSDARDLVAFILEQSGAIATVVDSAIAALDCFSQAKPDILISDIGMPGKDGYGLIQDIRTLPSDQGGQVPAIALTAYAGEIDQQQAIAAGFQTHMTKPVDAEELVQAIAQLTRHSKRAER
ncbi:GAF domain-containing protein [Phormidium sp. CLA17]|nr:GAF domain-containing protein [Leptolyngbya sp. Cla-17]